MSEPSSRLRPRRAAATGQPVTLYMAAEDLELWQRARTLAADRSVSLSSLVADALDGYVQEAEKEKQPT